MGSGSSDVIEVGSRVLAGREKATVRYVGPVNGQKGTWVGLEWDDPSRGKHDGSTGGVQYFTCIRGPTAGSFVRIEKVHPGVSLIEAVRLRYTNQQAEGEAAGTAEAQQQPLVHKKLQFQFVGEEKVLERQSQTQLLKSARLVDMGVSRMVSSSCCPLQGFPLLTMPFTHCVS